MLGKPNIDTIPMEEVIAWKSENLDSFRKSRGANDTRISLDFFSLLPMKRALGEMNPCIGRERRRHWLHESRRIGGRKSIFFRGLGIRGEGRTSSHAAHRSQAHEHANWVYSEPRSSPFSDLFPPFSVLSRGIGKRVHVGCLVSSQ